jgi:hypothetical protein
MSGGGGGQCLSKRARRACFQLASPSPNPLLFLLLAPLLETFITAFQKPWIQVASPAVKIYHTGKHP